VILSGSSLDEASWQVLTAISVGLLVGKPLGVLVVSWLSLRFGIATLPAGLNFRHLIVLGVVAGVGFTMALFIAKLAFLDEQLLAAGKLGVLVASGGAAVIALVLGRILLTETASGEIAHTADEAERSTEL
jgi:NhaA family Na+:H+ antiporter